MRVTSTGSSCGVVGAPAQNVAGDAEVVVLEHEPQRPHRLDDLDPQRTDAEGVHVGAEPARQADVVLLALVAEADEPVEHVVVLVEPHVRGQANRAVDVAHADVVPVVPLRVAAGHSGERLGDLVQRVLVQPDQHAPTYLSASDMSQTIIALDSRA